MHGNQTHNLALIFELHDVVFRTFQIFSAHTLRNASERTYLRDVDSRPEELQMFSHPLGFVFGVEDGQLSEHAHVSALQP